MFEEPNIGRLMNTGQETQSNVRTGDSYLHETNGISRISPLSSRNHELHNTNVAEVEQALETVSPNEILEITRRLADSRGTVNINLAYAPQVTNQNQIYESKHFDLSQSTGAQIGETIVNTKEKSTSSTSCSCGSTSNGEAERLASNPEIPKLKEMLLKRAAEESGKMTYPVQANLQISRVPIQISSKVSKFLEGLERYGHYNKRCDFHKTMKKPEGDIKLCEIFTHASEKAKEKSKTETNQAARDKFVDRHGNMVGMVGQAGIGKTTLARMLLQHIIDGKMLPETHYIFYIPFRDVDFVNETTLMGFALTGCCNWEQGDESDKKLLKVLKDNSNVVFIFDGLDEANTEKLSKPTPHCDLYGKHKSDMFVAKMLSGEIFTKAKKLLTSRPRQFFALHRDYRPHFVLDILGLNEAAQLNLCRQICGDSFEVVVKYLQSHPDIFACCYVPVNCIITMSIIHETMKEYGTVNVISLTDIFIRALEIFIESEHVRAHRDQVWKLSKLAWDGFLSKKIVFGEADFTKAHIDKSVFQAFLCTYVKGEIRGTILEGKKKSSFSHLTWHELFVAVYLMFFLPVKEFDELAKGTKLANALWDVVTKFLYGMCNSMVMDRLETVLYPKVLHNWKEKKEILYESVVNILKKGSSDADLLFRVFSWIREADDNDFNRMIADHIPIKFVFGRAVLPTDVVCITYVLKCSSNPMDIHFVDGWQIPSNTFNYFCEQFARLRVKVKSIDFGYNVIDDDGARIIAKCLHNVEEVLISRWNLTPAGVETIASHLQQCKIKKLNFRRNNVGDEGVRSIAKCLHNIDELNFGQCQITPVGAQALARELKQSKIKSVDFYDNDISDDGARALASCLGNIDELHVSQCGITSTGAQAIANQLENCKLKLLNLHGNDIRDAGAIAVAHRLNNIDKLELGRCGITLASLEVIASELKLSRIKLLNLHQNMFGDDGARALATSLGNIDELHVSQCGITSTGVQAIASQLVHCKIKSLNLSSNAIGDDGVNAIAKCLDKIDELTLRDCGVTSAGVEVIASHLNNFKMKMLDIGRNTMIRDEEAIVIVSCINNLDTLNLTRCSISKEGAEKIKKDLALLSISKRKVIGLDNQQRRK